MMAQETLTTDRIELIECANALVAAMVEKQTAKSDSEFASVVELSKEESQCYVAALDFLKKEFKAGAKATLYDQE